MEVGGVVRSSVMARWGIAGLMMVVVGVGMWVVIATPPFKYSDEQAHAGYVWALIDGELPTIDTDIPVERDPSLRERVEREQPGSHRTEIYTANNPPLVYVMAVPPTLVGRALDTPTPAMLVLRSLSVVATAVAVGCAYGLGRELTSGDETVGFAIAALTASTVGVLAATSIGGLDGVALASTTAVAWALVRVLRVPTTRGLVLLGFAAAFAVGVRPMSAVFAAVAVALALLGVAARDWRRLPVAASATIGPAVVAWGWFYGLNIVRYGDPTGSEALFEKLDRNVALTHSLNSGWPTRNVDHLVMDPLPRDQTLLTPAPTVAVVLSAFVILTLVLSITRGRGPRWWRSPVPAHPAVWSALIVLGIVPFVLTHLHVSGGGSAHPRYLMATVPLAAATAALVVASASRRLAVVVAAGTLVAGVVALGRSVAARRTGFLGNQLPPAVDGPAIPVAIVVAAIGLVVSAHAAWSLCRRPTESVLHQVSDT